MCLGKLRFLIHESAESEVAQLDVVLGIPKDVGWLDVSMEDFATLVVMALDEGRNNLRKYLPDDVFWHLVSLFLGLLNDAAHVSSRAVLHNDVDCGLLPVDDSVVITHNVRMV